MKINLSIRNVIGLMIFGLEEGHVNDALDVLRELYSQLPESAVLHDPDAEPE